MRRVAHISSAVRLLVSAAAIAAVMASPAAPVQAAEPDDAAAVRASQRTDCHAVPQPQRWTAAGAPDTGRDDAVISVHRGANALAPENTMPAFRHGFAYGAEMVEADVRTTADGVMVVLHDETVDRTTDGEDAVADMSYTRVRTLNAAAFGRWAGGVYDPVQIPTLEEVVALAAEVGRGVEFDIKEADALAVADLAARYGVLEESAFNTPDPRVAQRYPQARLIYNRDRFEPPAALYGMAASDTYGVFGSRLDEYTPESIAAIHDGCGLVMPHAYDKTFGGEAEDLVHARAIGADGAQVNQPDTAAAALDEPVETDVLRVGDLSPARPVLGEETLLNGLFRQGVARVPGGWVFSFNSALFRTDDDLRPVATNADAIPADLAAAGYNHLGDPDEDNGLLYVPLEQDDYKRDRQRIAVYDALTLSYVRSYEVELSHAAWVAVDGGTAWSMDEFTGDELLQFRLPSWEPIRRLKLERPLSRVQGGDVGPDGTLWLSTDDERSMVYAVDNTSGRVRTVGSMGHLPGEGEGIDVTPLPSGLLHTLQIDPNFVSTWFGHWAVPQSSAAVVPTRAQACLVDRSTGLGLPFQDLQISEGRSRRPAATGADGCVAVPPGAPVTFAGTPAALASTRSGRDVAVDDDERQPDWQPQPLARAHAHNDYEHPRPLLDALDNGFASVEADVWLQDGELRVAHESVGTTPGRTLQSLYLEPLRQRFDTTDGRVHSGWDETFHLLVDIKSEGETTYRAIDEALRPYREMLTVFGGDGVDGGAVTVTISGNRPRATMAAQVERLAGYDGRLSDLGSDASAAFIPLISDNWTSHFRWQGAGPMPTEERAKLRDIVSRAHERGQRVRFWQTPDQPGLNAEPVWAKLLAAGVDYINTDHLPELGRWLRANDPAPGRPTATWWKP